MGEGNSISRMGLHLCLQDDEGLRARTLKNAKDIFEAKPPKPQLEVIRTFEAKGARCGLRNQDASRVSDIRNLHRVREHPLCNYPNRFWKSRSRELEANRMFEWLGVRRLISNLRHSARSLMDEFKHLP